MLGFDFLVDDKFKPWLLEVNGSPGFHFDSGMDYTVKKHVLADTLRLLRFDKERRRQLLEPHGTEAASG